MSDVPSARLSDALEATKLYKAHDTPHRIPRSVCLVPRFGKALRSGLYLLALVSCLALSASNTTLKPEFEAFISEMVAKHGYESASLRALFLQVQPRQSIVRAMTAPATSRPWHEFRRRVIDNARIENGVRFWLQNAIPLERASREFGVPPEIIVATIGIETMYGRNTGTFKVLDALSTLAFDYPPRAEYFRRELEEYLLLGREAQLDVGNVRGSFAGAIGIPQFMPSSYRKYAIDFDADGRRDIVNSAADAIGSVAHYYRTFGWQTNAPIVVPADSGSADLGPLLAAGIKPQATLGELRARGLVFETAVADTPEAAVF